MRAVSTKKPRAAAAARNTGSSVGRVTPRSSPSADESAKGEDPYSEGEGPVRRPGSRPLADLLIGPAAIVIGVAVLVVGITALIGMCWLGPLLLPPK